MIKHNQDGVAGLMISLVLSIVLLLGAIGFGVWAYGERQDYKYNVDQKVTAAVAEAKTQESIAKDKQFAEAAKNPLRTYKSSDAYGSLHIEYPKTWSGYVDETSNSGQSLDGYFALGVVPAKDDQNSVFALRAQVVSQPYNQIVQNLSNEQRAGKIKVSAYALPKLPKVVGVRVSGLLQEKDTDMIILPLRSQTVKLWTEGSQYRNDFNNYILPNFTFVP